ncbi:DNA-binding transcriptional response regulator, NtrC family, contains REC, AAA-type ATPase, and a Fis-type DNA-binding domains [Geopseudomonas sagittaria]|uniref:DNA-binding transcriptional response regulator, NtrC family, contains REC, AAA-type ATPase, and a Fis-type DNA-binding domains n=1 Tax=Geopseudomonas sagittaria TaxID=1135990 RepID=A0A1I5Q1X0_9GAMM|nr:sigma-54 dependent transcriptional regulator [Pseudomonas sagittaria]SFP39971.1 DNA-binding transcriptional response regulator, NtrC family, contains REC, AAA-type ATPase, and a Fis-type DNA-binding domains [Pseudomonas sagittaria]
MEHSVLIVEDDEVLADNIRTYLERKGYEALLCESAEQALEIFAAQHPDVLLTDYCLPGMSGIELIRQVRSLDSQVKAVMMTAHGNVQGAVEAMKAGAYDYLTKPVVLAELKLLIEKALEARQLEHSLSFYRQRDARGAGLDALLGESAPMQALKSMVQQVLEAERHMTDGELPAVLIRGETGTGKELVARALHYDGVRRAGPFVEVNCASIPSHLLEAELFGHEKGAYTDAKERRVGLVEAADGGTLFLDEVGEIELPLQAKLLKLLEDHSIRRLGSVKERKIDLRIISATNCDLEQMVQEGRFRRDLFYRLRIIAIAVPPLRERGDDIVRLARHFLAVHGRRYGKPDLSFCVEAEIAMLHYEWPGNVRELRNLLEQVVLLTPGPQISPAQLNLATRVEDCAARDCPDPAPADPADSAEPDGLASLPAIERDLVLRTLDKTDWNVTKSARLLGLSRDMLRYRIEKLGLERPDRNH